MKVKVCGNTDLQQLKELNSTGIDYAGLIFYEYSSRYVLKKLSGSGVKDLNLSIEKVGVFVNASEDFILQQAEDFSLDIIQLHGDETASFCSKISDHMKVIKAFRVEDETNIDWLVKEYVDVCDFYLFDKGSTGLYGGTGQKFNWKLLENSIIGKPFFLSGGIAPGDVEVLKNLTHPYFYGVDINSKFEIEPGIKDIKLVKQFLSDLKK
jgi:phosphoribosylanthranilate isomerase